jgi:hypothetical protein
MIALTKQGNKMVIKLPSICKFVESKSTAIIQEIRKRPKLSLVASGLVLAGTTELCIKGSLLKVGGLALTHLTSASLFLSGPIAIFAGGFALSKILSGNRDNAKLEKAACVATLINVSSIAMDNILRGDFSQAAIHSGTCLGVLALADTIIGITFGKLLPDVLR